MSDRKEFDRRKAVFKAAIIHDVDMSASERLVGWKVTDMLNFRTGDAWPGQVYLADTLGLGIRTVRGAVSALVKRGWYTTEIDGRALRYRPNYARADITPAKDAAINTGKFGSNTGNFCKTTPAEKCPLSSLDKPKNQPTPVSGQSQAPSDDASMIDKGGGRQQEVVLSFANQSEEITKRARRGGAPVFVYEGSEPWRAWSEYRRRNNIPGDLPSRQRQVDGRLRTGWDCPTLYPPGFKREGAA